MTKISERVFDAGVTDQKRRAVATSLTIHEFAVKAPIVSKTPGIATYPGNPPGVEDLGLAVGTTYYEVRSQALRNGKSYGAYTGAVGFRKTPAEAHTLADASGARAIKRNRAKFGRPAAA